MTNADEGSGADQSSKQQKSIAEGQPKKALLSAEVWEWIKRTGTVVGLTGATVGVIGFFVNQNVRIGRLEAQMQATTITTAVKGDGGQTVGVPVNPVLQACADLGKRLAETTSVQSGYIKSAMEAMACDRLPPR